MSLVAPPLEAAGVTARPSEKATVVRSQPTAGASGDAAAATEPGCSSWDDGCLDPQAELHALVAHALLHEAATADPWHCLGLRHGAPPEALAGPDHVTCPGDVNVFDAGASSDLDGQITAYTWRFSDGVTLTGPRVERSALDGLDRRPGRARRRVGAAH